MTEVTQTDTMETRCGYVALLGRPNAGKSTLLNRLVGQKISIVTAKPQTTRNRILAVMNQGPVQAILLDTPGIHRPRGPLGRYMLEAANGAMAEADLLAWLVDVSEPKRGPGLTDEEQEIASRLGETGRPVIALVNKIDRLSDKSAILPLIEDLARRPGVQEVVPVSAQNGDGVGSFLAILAARLPAGPKLYPEDMLSEQAERFFVAELVREALTDLTREEVPYHSAVVVDQFVEEARRCAVRATIHVERASQRGILVGKGGSMIKAIGERARAEAEALLGCKVNLQLHVDVTPGWTASVENLKKMGYE